MRGSPEDAAPRHRAAGTTSPACPDGDATTLVGPRIAELPPVGRDGTLGTLMELTERLATGWSGICVLTGEPGVGKTRVLRELLGRVRAQGHHVLHGRAQEYDSSIAYAVLKDALASTPRADIGARVRAELDGLVDAMDRSVTGPEGDEVSRRQSPYVMTTRLLRSLTDERPCVIAVDDAHLADEESLAALCLAARHLRNRPLLLVFVLRSGRPVPGTAFAATVGRLVEEGSGPVVHLAPLSEEDTRTLICTALDASPDPRLVQHVFAQSRGNPLFAWETLLALTAQRAIRSAHGRLYLSGEPGRGLVSRRGALLHRIFQQDEDARRLARVMSAFGRVHLDQLSLVAELTGLDEPRVQRAFDALTESAVLARVGSGGFEFAHPLMAEVLYDDLGPVERRRVHAAISAYTDAHPDPRIGLLERAAHAVEAASPGDPVAIEAALQAARATRDTAPLSAARWLNRALELAPPGSGQAGEILAQQTQAYWKGSRPDLAIDAGIRASELLPAGRRRTSTALTVINAAYATGRLSEALELSERLMPGDDAPAAMVAQRSLLLTYVGRAEEAAELAALAWTRLRCGDPEARAVTYSSLAFVENMVGSRVRAEQALDGLWHLATDGADALPVGARLSALESWTYISRLTDRTDETPVSRELIESLSGRTGWLDLGGQAVSAFARVQWLRGEWDAALDTIHSGVIALEFAGLSTNLAWLRMLEARILLAQGAPAPAQEVVDGVRLPEQSAYWCAQRDVLQARLDVARDPAGDGAERLAECLRSGVRTGWHDVVAESLGALVDRAMDRDDPGALESSAVLVRRLAERADSLPLRLVRAVDAAEALLHRDPASAVDVLRREQAAGIPLATARAHFLLALLDHDAASHLGAAACGFEALGARAWSQRTQALAQARGIPLVRSRPVPEDSAPRLADIDLQLLQLVRDGLNNREIAEAMHYSRKTVEAYLSRLYRKTGSTSRISLVLTAEREGWLSATAAGSRS
ncbi:ATP-binding protein [Blastococcus capsensis]|uniref:ATP-binding protein n=1 Tax=Blastococcus capsensis TaxID=1564163 RepID=UPI00254137BF|nr:AAA family ATPase [Blastococcus capsensis]MDK3256905.1 AAA family ATPase [Blastococcus capsensis]